MQKIVSALVFGVITACAVDRSIILAAGTPDLWQAGEGRYVGTLLLAPLVDGRHMKIAKPYAYLDRHGIAWIVPAGTIVDGASIPRAFWSIAGGPFEGRYRDASVIHDFYCDTRTRSWQSTDRVFYEAMLTSGVSPTEAKILYMAVIYGGPHWDNQTIANNLIAGEGGTVTAAKELGLHANRAESTRPSDASITSEAPGSEANLPVFNDITARRLASRIADSNPTIDEIDKMVSDLRTR